MTIQTIDELLYFIETNYEKLTDKNYIDLCKGTMHLYEYDKPDTKEKALQRIRELYTFTQSYSSVQELPLFMEENN